MGYFKQPHAENQLKLVLDLIVKDEPPTLLRQILGDQLPGSSIPTQASQNCKY